MKTLIISDTHFGNGQGYDAYAGAQALPVLIERYAAPDHRVVIAGDSVDFLMNEDPLELQVERALGQARQIAEATDTRAAFRALGQILAAGGQVVIRLGNHDVELVLPQVQEVFRLALGQPEEVARKLEFQLGQRPWVIEEQGVRVLVSHGEHNDNWNKLAYDRLLGEGEKVRPEKFEYPPGSRLVKTLLNPLKKNYSMRFADLLKPDFQGAALTALAVDPRAVKTVFQRSNLTLVRQLFGRIGSEATFDPNPDEPDLGLAQRLEEAGLSRQEIAALEASLDDEALLSFGLGDNTVFDAAAVKLARAGLRAFAKVQRALVGDQGDRFFSIDPSAEEWREAERLATKFQARAVILGHTHAARFRGSDSLTFINTGTWIWLMKLPSHDADDAEWMHFLEMLRRNPSLDPTKGEAPELLARFTAATIEPAKGGGIDLALVRWTEDGTLETLGAQRLEQATRAAVIRRDLQRIFNPPRKGMSEEKLYFNGLRANGDYLTEPMSPKELVKVLRGRKLPESKADELHAQELKNRTRMGEPVGRPGEHLDGSRAEPDLAPMEGLDPKQLDQVGWGVVFPAMADGSAEAKEQEEIREALQPLLDHRKAQAAARNERYFRELSGPDGFRLGETKRDFLKRHGVGAGPTNPEKMPYYLLLVGDPREIPFKAQYQLDVQYAVGRIHFDKVKHYRAYAESVVQAEKQGLLLPRHATFFGVAAPDDPATQGSAANLIRPLADVVEQGQPSWKVERRIAERATKSDLGELLGGAATPAFLMTASHGMSFKPDDDRIITQQGALICQEWPGPKAWYRKPITEDLYFSGDDLASDAQLLGLIAFFFACYGGGTPEMDEFSKREFREPKSIAPNPFVAELPKRLLGHPKGGALAVIGHVERAWSASFLGPKGRDGDARQLEVFESTFKRLLEGHPVGSAMEYFNQRYAELSTELTERWEDIENGAECDDYEIAQLWTHNNDARNYTIIGDPAVRLLVGGDEKPGRSRQAIQIRVDVPAAPSNPIPKPQAASTAEPQHPEAEGGESVGEASQSSGDEFGIIGDARQTLVDLGQRLREDLFKTVSQSIDALTTVEVKTYIADQLPLPELPKGKPLSEVGKLFAVTRLDLSGDVETLVGREEGKIDKRLLAAHTESFENLLEHRRKTMASLVKALGQSLKLVAG